MLLFLLLSDPLFSFPEMDTIIKVHDFKMGLNDTLVVSVENGDIYLMGSKEKKLRIKSLLIFPKGKKPIKQNIEIRKLLHKIIIKGKVKKPNKYLRTSFEISVPERAKISVMSDNGDIKIFGIRNEINARSINGDIICNKIEGRINLISNNGDIDFKEPKGILGCKCTNGDISGEIGKDIPDSIFLTVGNGSVSLKIKLRNPLIKAEAANGKIFSDFPYNIQAPSKRPTIIISASNGDIYIKKIQE